MPRGTTAGAGAASPPDVEVDVASPASSGARHEPARGAEPGISPVAACMWPKREGETEGQRPTRTLRNLSSVGGGIV